MKNNEVSKERCEFTVHPCNFKVEIKKVRPFYVCHCKSILLDLRVITNCNTKSFIKIKSKPKYGKVYLLGPSTLLYKSTKRISGLDLFQILVENQYGGMSIESILIRII